MLVLLVLISLLLSISVALRDGIHSLVVDYNVHYYYESLQAKMKESMSVNTCSMDGDANVGRNEKGRGGDLSVVFVPPSSALVDKWDSRNPARPAKLLSQVSDSLCVDPAYKEIVRGEYTAARGCYKIYVKDKNGVLQKRFPDFVSTLHPSHVRCEFNAMAGHCSGNQSTMLVVPNHMRKLHEHPFLVTAKNVIVGRGGMFAMPCGPFGLFASCEAVKWGIPVTNATVEFVEQCRDPTAACPYPRVGKVFIITQFDDTEVGQFMQEVLPKLVYHLDWLHANPDVRIHFGFNKEPELLAHYLPHHFFNLILLKNRLINGTVFANEVYMPREGGCQDIGYNAWEVVSMRERFFKLLHIRESKGFVVSPPTVTPTLLVLTRSDSEFANNNYGGLRSWPADKFQLMLDSLQTHFPRYNIEVFSDSNRTVMLDLLRQVKMFSRADVVVGMHGAGLSNSMFMRPGSTVVEVVYDFDARHAPVIGIFPRLSGVIGLHHYSMLIKRDFDVDKFSEDIANFVRKVRKANAQPNCSPSTSKLNKMRAKNGRAKKVNCG